MSYKNIVLRVGRNIDNVDIVGNMGGLCTGHSGHSGHSGHTGQRFANNNYKILSFVWPQTERCVSRVERWTSIDASLV